MADMGDDGFTEFCDVEWPRLVNALGMYTGDVLVAQELAQEALTRAYQRWGTVSSLESPGGWTRKVAINLARSSMRRRHAELRALSRARQAARIGVPTSPVDSDDALVVRDALTALDDKQRQVLVCRFYLDLSVDDTAATLRLSDANVRVITHRGLRLLAGLIEPGPGHRSPVPITTRDENS